MLVDFNQSIEEEARLLDHLIKQNKWTDSLLTFIPEHKGSRLLMKNIKMKNDIFKTEEPFAFVYDVVNQPCVLIESNEQHVALINVKSFAAYKQNFIENDFYTLTSDADYVFALLFIMDCYAWVELVQQKKVHSNLLNVDEFSAISIRALELYMESYDKRDHYANLVEYFFHKFTRQFRGISNFEQERIKMLKPLGYIIGGFM